MAFADPPPKNALTIDVEDWFHILDSDETPSPEKWPFLQSRVDRNLRRILALLAPFSAKATFFWLGWVAERHKGLVRECQDAGHEIASHGYAHVLPYMVGRKVFREDIQRAKAVLEDIIGQEVLGFRAAGFGITKKTPWAFEIIKEVGYEYDSSVFPALRGHGGIPDAKLEPHFVETGAGRLFGLPLSVVRVFGWRVSLFGGGYLRLAPVQLIRWGIRRLEAARRPLIIYIHPRDIDPDQPRLPLPPIRRFKCYVNLHTTFQKIRWLCENYRFSTMRHVMEAYMNGSCGNVEGARSLQLIVQKS
jgi:polysaccharide deacetylase family protein (PEP-CTERM system associated)